MKQSTQSQLTETIITVIFSLLIFTGGYWFGQSRFAPIQIGAGANGTPVELASSFDPFWQIWNAINEDYFTQPLDPDVLVEGAINGMLAALEDPNTAYLSPQEQELAQQQMNQEFQGIGAEVQSGENGEIIIVAPFEGSPAAAAGLRPRDIIRQADGTELTGMDVGDAAALVRGPAGTDVTLLIQRGEDTFEVVVTRDTINIPSVTGEIIEDDLAYVRLSRFADKTAEELDTILDELLAQNPRGLILDLRLNPGGALDTVVDVGDEFLDDGVLLIERFGDGSESIFETSSDGSALDIPMVVLIDEGSASASEALAGAIRDRDRGILIGQTSFGKGTVQIWQPLRNGGGVRLTIARWLTPDGGWVHEVGLVPDQLVPLPEFDENFEDTQLQAAIDYFDQE